jgi:thioredoxin reductase (NADPH)
MRTPEQIEAMVPVSDRSAQRFPRLRETQLELVRRFANAEARRFSPGENIFEVGDRGVPAWFLLEGTADLFGRDGLEQEIALRELDSGHFTGELHQLGDRPTLAGARAGADGCVALPLDATRLRALIVGSAELGELIMRAFILRRVGLLERGVGPVLLGRAGSAELLRLQAFLTRNGYPHLVLNCASERGRQLLDDLALPPEDLPLLICACGRVLKRPTNEEASAWLGITPTLRTGTLYDVAVIGSGPAGLATAVYAASEGLSVLVVDGEVLGGQAGASARIENYLGFPTGISGLALTGRALNQAQKFGAEVAIPLVATRLECGDTVALTLSEQGSVRARAVVVASGARYKRPPITNLKSFEGDSVHYWASPVEAKLCTGEEIALVGAGNSAGQAVVFLAPHVKRLTMIVRGAGLEASMSRYLIDRIRSLENVDIQIRSEIVELHGDRGGALEGVTVRNRDSGATSSLPVRQVFMFIGAEPNTAWLNGCLALDEHGYILTGLGPAAAQAPAPLPLQTSLSRVFAIGDVRAGSTKRVASAVGEGAAVVAQIHSILGAATTTA